jgi:hypothetical protein
MIVKFELINSSKVLIVFFSCVTIDDNIPADKQVININAIKAQLMINKSCFEFSP